MLPKLLYLLHVVATVIWVGGMFFAHQCLRPAALACLEPPLRLALWRAVFARFFPWVWAAVVTLVLSGQVVILELGGMAETSLHVQVMAGVGYVMAVIFAYLFFVPYRTLDRAVGAQDWKRAAAALNRIRALVGTNLSLGLLNIVLVFLLPPLLAV